MCFIFRIIIFILNFVINRIESLAEHVTYQGVTPMQDDWTKRKKCSIGPILKTYLTLLLHKIFQRVWL
jgi:hypothetical protein